MLKLISVSVPVALVGVAWISTVSCTPELEPEGFVSVRGECMGTFWSAVVLVPEGSSGVVLRGVVQGELDAVDLAMSTWKPGSDLSRFNRAAAGEVVEVGSLTLDVMGLCGALVEATGGAFDPTVLPLVRVWGFGTHDETEPPTAASIEGALGLVDWAAVQIDAGSLSKTLDGVEVDLSAVAKGHAVDLAAEALVAAGCTSFLLDVGGEVVLKGQNRTGHPWRVGVVDPLLPSGQEYARLSLTGMAVATSGDYRNVREVDGRIVAHAIDPRTGQPIDHDLASVTVLASTCAVADALATAALVLGPEAGLALLEAQDGVEGYLLSRVGAGDEVTLQAASTTGMAAFLMPAPTEGPGPR